MRNCLTHIIVVLNLALGVNGVAYRVSNLYEILIDIVGAVVVNLRNIAVCEVFCKGVHIAAKRTGNNLSVCVGYYVNAVELVVVGACIGHINVCKSKYVSVYGCAVIHENNIRGIGKGCISAQIECNYRVTFSNSSINYVAI